jgi:hypothetical protein
MKLFGAGRPDHPMADRKQARKLLEFLKAALLGASGMDSRLASKMDLAEPVIDTMLPARGRQAPQPGAYTRGENLETTISGRQLVYMPQGVAERGEDYEIVRTREMVRE